MPTPSPLRSTADGRAHDPIDIVNHLAEWLEPLRLTVETAEAVQTLVDTAGTAGTATSLVDAAELNRLNAAARRWVRDNDRSAVR